MSALVNELKAKLLIIIRLFDIGHKNWIFKQNITFLLFEASSI